MSSLKSIEKKWHSLLKVEKKSTHLLKRDLLREAGFILHRTHSEHLFKKNPIQEQKSIQMEKSLLQSLWSPSIQEDFLFYLNTPPHIPKGEEKKLPLKLLKIIPLEKLNRFDRTFEKALAYFSYKEKCAFYEVHMEIPLHKIQKFHERFKKILWPQALILFVEAQNSIHSIKSPSKKKPVWGGVWTLILLPETNITSLKQRIKKLKKEFLIRKIS